MLKKTFMLKKCFICLQGEYSLSVVMILKGHEQKGITKIYFLVQILQSLKSNLHHLLQMSFKKENGCADSQIAYLATGQKLVSNCYCIPTSFGMLHDCISVTDLQCIMIQIYFADQNPPSDFGITSSQQTLFSVFGTP